MKFLVLLLAVFSFQIRATDCHTDCESHFSDWWQAADLGRCQAERKVACKTGITTCDVWRANLQTVAPYYAAIKVIETANRQSEWPKDANSCHSAVDLGSTASSGVGAAKFLYKVWDTGFRMADILSRSTVVGLVISEGAKSFAHCACTHASYVPPADENPEKDRYFVSLFSDRWSVSWGANNFANRKALLQSTQSQVGGNVRKRQMGSYGSQKRTLAEAICENGTFWAINIGDASIKIASDEVKRRNWAHCLFRIKNFSGHEPKVSDLFFASAGRNDGAWAIRTGDIHDQASILKAARDALGNRYDILHTGRFSSNRATVTFTSCSKPPTTSGGLIIGSASLFLTGGHGNRSVAEAIAKANAQHAGESCTFKVRDVDFGPLH